MSDPIKIKVEVTRDDLDNGLRSWGDSCPLALAMKRARSDIIDIEVSGDDIFFREIDRRCGWSLRKSSDAFLVRDFTRRYDNEEYVSPFTHEFEFMCVDYYDEDE